MIRNVNNYIEFKLIIVAFLGILSTFILYEIFENILFLVIPSLCSILPLYYTIKYYTELETREIIELVKNDFNNFTESVESGDFAADMNKKRKVCFINDMNVYYYLLSIIIYIITYSIRLEYHMGDYPKLNSLLLWISSTITIIMLNTIKNSNNTTFFRIKYFIPIFLYTIDLIILIVVTL